MKLDLHLHTIRSPDSLTTYDALIRAVEQSELDAIAVTDHNTITGARELAARAPFPIIVAEEIRTTVGEIIGYFLKDEIPAGLPLGETIARVKAQGGLVAVPHPVDRFRRASALGRTALLQVIDQVDVIEGFNARCVLAADNRAAQQIAREYGKPVSAGSDAHSARELGHTYVEMAPFDGPADFLMNLETARWYGEPCSPLLRLSSVWAKIVKAKGA